MQPVADRYKVIPVCLRPPLSVSSKEEPGLPESREFRKGRCPVSGRSEALRFTVQAGPRPYATVRPRGWRVPGSCVRPWRASCGMRGTGSRGRDIQKN